jgi:zinc transport system substrate-binding protein
LGHVAEPSGFGEGARGIAEELHRSGRGVEESEQESEQRGLAGAVRSHQSHELTRRQGEADVGHDRRAVVGEREAAGGKDWGWQSESDSQYYRAWSENDSQNWRQSMGSTKFRPRIAVLLATGLVLAACGSSHRASGGQSTSTAVAAFFPIAATVRALGGPTLAVRDLTPPGVEPHDLEPTTDQVDAILDADLAVVMGHGFQPAVERAAKNRDGATVKILDLLATSPDPHVWLDPVTMQRVTRVIAQGLVRAEPRLRAVVAKNLRVTIHDLRVLDTEFRRGLSRCRRHVIVTAHAAFGRLAARYGLRQEAIAGIDPEQDPDPRRMAELTDLVHRDGVTTVFTEELVSPRVAQTLAREAGVSTKVLSPIESPPRGATHFSGYLDAMRRNLTALRRALGCR